MSTSPRAWHLRDVVSTTLGAGVLIGMLALSALDPRLALVCAIAVVVCITVFMLGPEQAGARILVCAMFTAPMTTIRPTGAIPFITVSDILLGLGFVLLLPRLIRTRPNLPKAFTVGAWLLVAASVVPITLSLAPFDNLGYLARLVAAVVLLPLAFAYWHPDLRTIRVLAWAYVAGTLVGWVLGALTSTGEITRQQGLTSHPNFLALTGQIAATLLIFLYLTAAPRHRWVAGVCGVLSLFSVVSSGSRSGLIALAFTVMVFPFANRSPRAAYLMIATGVVATFLGGRFINSAAEGSALRRIFIGDKSTAGSNLQRETALGNGWSDFLARPFTGGGFTERTLETHNIYVEVGQGAGIFGLIGFLLLLWAAVRTILGRGPLAPLGYTALGYALVGLFQPTLWDRLVWVAVGLTCVAATRYDPPDHSQPPLSPDPSTLKATART